MPGESGVTVVTMLVCSFYFACEAAGASRARHSLRPLFSEGKTLKQNSREMRGEIAKLYPDVIARSNATKQSTFVSWPLWIASLTLAMTVFDTRPKFAEQNSRNTATDIRRSQRY